MKRLEDFREHIWDDFYNFAGLQSVSELVPEDHQDFCIADKRGMDLSGRDLRTSVSKLRNVEGCNLSGCDLRGHRICSHFDHANLEGVKIAGCPFYGVNFTNLQNTTWSGIDFTGCVIQVSKMENIRFENCIFVDAKFNENTMNGCVFEGCTFKDVQFYQCKGVFQLINCSVENVKFYVANFEGAGNTFKNCVTTAKQTQEVEGLVEGSRPIQTFWP